MTDEYKRRAKEFQESVWVAMEGWQVLPEEWSEDVKMFDELFPFASMNGSGLSVALEGFPSERATEEGVDAILNRTGSAPEPDNVKISTMPHREDWGIRFRFLSDGN